MTSDPLILDKEKQHTTPSNTSQTPINSEDVILFLSQNPDFLIQNPDLFSQLELTMPSTDEHSDQVISLAQHQAAMLRKDKKNLTDQLNKLIDVSKINGTLYKQTRDLIIHILKQTSLSNLINLLNNDLQSYYAVQSTRIILLDSRFQLSAPDHTQDLTIATTKIDSILKNQSVVCGSLREKELEFLFEDASLIKSAAVLPLHHEGVLLGVLSLGSTDIEHFKAGSDTVLIDFLSEIICLSIQRFIDV